jgi:hypothetical protein
MCCATGGIPRDALQLVWDMNACSAEDFSTYVSEH